MKRILSALLTSAALIAAAVSVTSGPAAASTVMRSVEFAYTGAPQDFEVPAGVTSLSVLAVGGAGADAPAFRVGGVAHAVAGTLDVTPGETLRVFVGGDGAADGTAAFNGGGRGGSDGSIFGGGGGGATDVRRAPAYGAADRLFVAAGGGGAAVNSAHGGHGGDAGVEGNSFFGETGGGPGTQFAGGAGGSQGNEELEVFDGESAAGASGGAGGDSFEFAPGGGGGGGLFGGGGGAGGAGFCDPSCVFPPGGGGGGSSSTGVLSDASIEWLDTPPRVVLTYAIPPSPTSTAYTGPSSGRTGGPVTLSGTLRRTDSSPVGGRTLDFALGAQSCSGTTDGSGIASCQFTISQGAGPTTVTASFAGDEDFAASTTGPRPFTIVTVPGSPAGVSAAPGNGRVTVGFSPPASDGGSSITGYTATCGAQSAAGLASPITVTGLTNGVTVSCTVYATNAAGDGPESSPPVSVTPATVPGAPVGVSAASGNGRVTVGFSPPASDGGSSIASYTATCGSRSVSGPASPITVTGLTNGVTVSCTVYATNAAGDGPKSSSVSVKPVADPTTLRAAPAVLEVKLPWLRLSIINASATLSNSTTGAPIAGQSIRFRAGTQLLCTAVTDSGGVAKCPPVAVSGILATVLTGGYDAHFEGTAALLPSAARGRLVGGV